MAGTYWVNLLPYNGWWICSSQSVWTVLLPSVCVWVCVCIWRLSCGYSEMLVSMNKKSLDTTSVFCASVSADTKRRQSVESGLSFFQVVAGKRQATWIVVVVVVNNGESAQTVFMSTTYHVTVCVYLQMFCLQKRERDINVWICVRFQTHSVVDAEQKSATYNKTVCTRQQCLQLSQHNDPNQRF